MARYGTGRRQGGGYGGVLVVLFVFLLAAGAGGYWLWSHEDRALAQLRLEADTQALRTTIAFPQAPTATGEGSSAADADGPGDAASAGSDTGADSPAPAQAQSEPTQSEPDQSAPAQSAQTQSAQTQSAPDEQTTTMAPTGDAPVESDGDATDLTVADSGDAAPRALPPPGRPEPPSLSSPGTDTANDADTDVAGETTSQPATTTVTEATQGGESQLPSQSAAVSISELMRGAQPGASPGDTPPGADSTGANSTGDAQQTDAPSDGEPATDEANAGHSDAAEANTADPLADQLAQLSGIAGLGAQMATVMPPRELNAEPFLEPRDRPRIAIVIADWPSVEDEADALMAQLPQAATVAISRDLPNATRLINRARVRGHEVLVTLPFDGAEQASDALRLDRSGQENIARLDAVLAGADRAVGLIGVGDGSFMGDATAIGPVLTQVALDGYLFVTGPGNPHDQVARLAGRIGLPVAGPAIDLTASPSRPAIDAALDRLADQAERDGGALATARASAALVAALADWQADLDARGLSLAPITAIADAPQ